MNEEREAESSPPPRRGDVDKCPVCGAGVDREAYHCSTCQNDFCFHCRARLLPSDEQFECVNQGCVYYGKLICKVCESIDECELEASIYREPQDGYWPAWLIGTIFIGMLIWYFSSFMIAFFLAVVIYGVGGFLLHISGVNLFGREREVRQERRTHLCHCICCGQQVKKLVVPNV